MDKNLLSKTGTPQQGAGNLDTGRCGARANRALGHKRTEAYGPLQAVAERRQRKFGVYPSTAVI